MTDRGFAFASLHQEIGIERCACDFVHLLESPEVLTMFLNCRFLLNLYDTFNHTRERFERQLEMGIRGFCVTYLTFCRSVIDGYLKSL
jgi:hypothetical protein